MRATTFTLAAAAVLLAVAGCGESRNQDPTDFLVITSSPANLQTNVPAASVIQIRFTEPVDHRTVIGTNQVILVDQGNSVVPISYSFDGEIMSVTPGSPLGSNRTYGIAVREGVRDIYGQNIDTPFAATFSTGMTVTTIPNWPPFMIQSIPAPVPLGASGTFTVVGPLAQARAWHTQNLLFDGRVLVTGGERTVGFSNTERSAELFDYKLLTWSNSKSNGAKGMYYCRAGHTATLLTNGKVFISGGTPNGKEIHATAEMYDPITDNFTAVACPMTSSRVFHTATLLSNGNVLLVGGVVPINNPFTILTDTMEVFDMNGGVFNPCVVTLLAQNVFIQQPGQPIQAGQLPLGRAFHTANTLPDGSVLIAGGYTPPDVFIPFTTTDSQIYIPDAYGAGHMGTIRHTANTMRTSRACHTATTIPSGEAVGLIYIFGGFSNNPYTGACASGEVFDISAVATAANSQFLGQNGCFTMLAANMNSTRRGHTATFIPAGLVWNPNKQSNNAYQTSDGLILLAGGACYAGIQTQVQTPPYPDLWLEPVGCACSATISADLFDPWAFGKVPGLSFRGTDQSGACFQTRNASGVIQNIPQCAIGRFNHRASGFPNGQVLLTGGMDCGFCIPAPFEGIMLSSCVIYNP